MELPPLGAIAKKHEIRAGWDTPCRGIQIKKGRLKTAGL